MPLPLDLQLVRFRASSFKLRESGQVDVKPRCCVKLRNRQMSLSFIELARRRLSADGNDSKDILTLKKTKRID